MLCSNYLVVAYTHVLDTHRLLFFMNHDDSNSQLNRLKLCIKSIITKVLEKKMSSRKKNKR